jgi:hypothetical protein
MTIFKLCVAAMIALIVGAWAERAKAGGPVGHPTKAIELHSQPGMNFQVRPVGPELPSVPQSNTALFFANCDLMQGFVYEDLR